MNFKSNNLMEENQSILNQDGNKNIPNQEKIKNNNDQMEMNIEEEEKINNLKKTLTKFLNEHTIYEAIPEDMKILVFNDELLIKDSIEAMIKEDIYCGLLYNSEQNKHSGVFTIRDVLGLLLIGYRKLVSFLNNNKNINTYDALKNNLNNFFAQFGNENEDELKNNKNINKENNQKHSNENDMDIEEEDNDANKQKISNENLSENDPKIYNDMVKDFNQFISLFENITLQSFIELFHIKENGLLISLFSDCNLEECIKTIQKNNIHRLIVQDKKSNNLSGFITYEAIFEYFIENYYSSMTEFNIPLKHLDIIVNKVITLNKNETLHKSMETFYKEGISMIPIMDEGNIFGYLYLKDIIYFFSTGEKFNFGNSIESFLIDLYEGVDDERPYGNKRIMELKDDTNLKEVFEKMSISPERKLIITNDNNNIGVVALYDIFKKLLI
jgi:predicted transcriptional regulator